MAGNVWTFDSYERQINVFQTGPNTFCATTSYDGEFTTNAGEPQQHRHGGGGDHG